MRSDFDFPIEKPKLLRPSVNVVRQKEYAEEKRKAQCNLIAKMLTMSDTELMTLSTREILEYSHNSNPVQVGDEGSESGSDNELPRNLQESDSDNEERLISPRKTQFPRITSGSERSSQDYTPQKLPQKTPKSTPQPRTPQPNTPIQIQRPALQASFKKVQQPTKKKTNKPNTSEPSFGIGKRQAKPTAAPKSLKRP
ncbi:hypothetical protein FDP41_010661 [Naegleria fowleri]|uniref:Uncharacterized protein n=1 Tax=Naegleria fowleri TaxID=5763 RepID=A0A6A5C764_NAEFO|nr:uncharacterized protein FDP41_010661 [Naegleria fowleri]KAF0983596.1 hypothetical protein FDP41_010661 [Naegleria fowleri]